ncbi:hypothetical protein [Aurantibacillus circumpalustris]|uniref:hypothetical protein n=1 Tax=Aurantibacillus circumpalustris TaxID=3036359 RepID=UPI00295BB2CB|nr:hypothetical protein [Aurantibacillus circumpalustris]
MKRILTALLCLVTLFSCKKEEPKEPPPLPPVVNTGDISGKVTHYDQFGTAYTSNLNTTTVSIEGYGFSTVTDALGSYTLSGVTSNTYTLVFNKPGCGLIKKQKLIYTLGDTVKYDISVADIPTFSLDMVYAKDTSWFNGTLKGIYYGASASVQNKKAMVVAIFGKTQNLDIDFPATYLNYVTASRADTSDFKRFFSYSLLKDTYNFKKDSIVYMRIYPVSTLGSSYYDSKFNTPVFTAHGIAYPTLLSLYVQ